MNIPEYVFKIILIVLFVSFAIVFGLFAIDYIFGKTIWVDVMIIEKNYVPSRTRIVSIPNGKTITPKIFIDSESYRITAVDNDKNVYIRVLNKDTYENIKIGDKTMISKKVGYITGHEYKN